MEFVDVGHQWVRFQADSLQFMTGILQGGGDPMVLICICKQSGTQELAPGTGGRGAGRHGLIKFGSLLQQFESSFRLARRPFAMGFGLEDGGFDAGRELALFGVGVHAFKMPVSACCITGDTSGLSQSTKSENADKTITV